MSVSASVPGRERRALVVSDTGPLIALARVGQLGLLPALYERVRVPSSVLAELQPGSGLPGAVRIAESLEDGWLLEQRLPGGVDTELARLMQLLDPGEAEAVLLCQSTACRFLLIDERRGRRVARSRGIPIVGTAGVLMVAKQRGLIAFVLPVIRDLKAAGYWFSAELVAEVRRLTAE
jgi:predicted nucleic acid-binding protein